MPQGLSFHIGVNHVDPGHYQGWRGPLNACEADATDMEDIATQMGFSAQNVLTASATRSAVRSGIEAAAQVLDTGDLFFLSYSGHGGQVPDWNGDETDLQDETWCLFDGQLIDDELKVLWGQFKPGVRILVLSDSCHSGTVTRAAYDVLATVGASRHPVSRVDGDQPPVYRTMPDEAALRTYRANRNFYRAIHRSLPASPPPIRATIRLISGCQDNQLSLDGTFNGLFTGTLLRVWNDGSFQGNYSRFHQDILRRMPPTQSPNHLVIGPPNPAFDAQRPFEI